VNQVGEQLGDVAQLVGLESVDHRVLLGEHLVEAGLVRRGKHDWSQSSMSRTSG